LPPTPNSKFYLAHSFEDIKRIFITYSIINAGLLCQGRSFDFCVN
jgi:hypothetical protein